MKILTLLACLILLPSASFGQGPAQKMKQLEWLLGNWKRTNAKPGKSGFEIWTKVSDAEWHGRGISMKGVDTTFVEKLRLIVENNKLYYVADVPENKKSVYFEITSVTPESFTCENAAHDFPKKIFYRFDGKQLYARVSAGEQGMDYWFERGGN